MRRSKIFTNHELDEKEKRESGDFSDKYGTFTRKVKPKIVEILSLFEKKNELEDLIKKK